MKKEKIPGGLASGMDIASFDADSIKKGIKAELEHTSDVDIATEIAMDHLAEDPLYYDKLKQMEKGACKMKLKIKKVLKEEQCLDEMCGDMVDKPQEMAPPDFSGTPDEEGAMADSQMYKVHQYSRELMDMIDDEMQLPSWVQAKLTKVADYMGAVKHFLEGEMALKEAEQGLSVTEQEETSKPDFLDFDKDGDKKEPMTQAIKQKNKLKLKKKSLDEKKKKFPDLTGDGKVTRADILKGRGVIDEDLLEENFVADLKNVLLKIKEKIPNLDLKQILANADAIKKAFSALMSSKNSVKEGAMQNIMAVAQSVALEYGLLATGVAVAMNDVMSKKIPGQGAIEMIVPGLQKTNPAEFFTDKGDIFAEEETYIVEGECEDDKTVYEMELYSEECGCGALEESLDEAEYRGRKVPLNKPMRGDVKKFKVYVKDPKTGNVKKVNFGDKNMRIKKSNPKRRKSFRARHNCDNPGPKTKARYWSCRKWEE